MLLRVLALVMKYGMSLWLVKLQVCACPVWLLYPTRQFVPVWFGTATNQVRYRFQWIIKNAKNNCNQPAFYGRPYIAQVRKAEKVFADPSYPAQKLFQFLPSGCCYRALQMKTTGHRDSFFLWAITLLNT
uniref:Uncharacterized protein n=1 Tax=Micrurus lemniscatus lemniscatus TaxID=129467 RepID=A0A2D4I285_MICLE